MREEAPPKGIYVGDANRWNLARDLALTAGVPPLLCANALQIFSDRADQAMMWLLDRGSLHRDDILNPDRVDFQKVVDKDSIWDWIQADEEDDMENEDEEEEDEEEYGDMLLREMMRLMGLPPVAAHHMARRYGPSRTSNPFMMPGSSSRSVPQTRSETPRRRPRRSMKITDELKTTKIRGRSEVLCRPLNPELARTGDLVIVLEKKRKRKGKEEEEEEEEEVKWRE